VGFGEVDKKKDEGEKGRGEVISNAPGGSGGVGGTAPSPLRGLSCWGRDQAGGAVRE